MAKTVAEALVSTLAERGVRRVYGIGAYRFGMAYSVTTLEVLRSFEA